ncbi:hypothetical protein BH11ARM2_BH11ARM2_25730 [soil metagenome]
MIARLAALTFLTVALTGCGQKSDPTDLAAPPPKADAVAPPATPNAKQGGPQDMAPGSGAMHPGQTATTGK